MLRKMDLLQNMRFFVTVKILPIVWFRIIMPEMQLLDVEEPSVWDFYIRNISKQEYEERIGEINPDDHYAVKTYTGYADIHPVYAIWQCL